MNYEPQWSFLSAGESGTTDPMYGNVSVDTVAGQRFYELKTDSDSITTDYGSVDWDNFYITTVGVAGESAPYTGKNLEYCTLEQWKRFRRVSENKDDAEALQTYKILCNRNFGKAATLSSPRLNHFGSKEFCFESYLETKK